MQYLSDLEVNLENAELLLALEIVQAPGLGELSKDPFIDGWKAVGYAIGPIHIYHKLT
jgi:DCN1-like protein 1/2